MITCLANGNWSDAPPTCPRKHSTTVSITNLSHSFTIIFISYSMKLLTVVLHQYQQAEVKG